jgi:hypothetical protein
MPGLLQRLIVRGIERWDIFLDDRRSSVAKNSNVPPRNYHPSIIY